MTRAQTIAELSRLTGHFTAIGLMNYLSRRALVSDEAVNLEDAATCDLEAAYLTLLRGTNPKPPSPVWSAGPSGEDRPACAGVGAQILSKTLRP